MYAIYLVFTLLFLWFCISGGTLVVARLGAHYAIARSLAIVGFVTLFFFVEHFIGLGRLHWLLPVLLAASGYVYWKNKETVRSQAFVNSELIFAAAFLYAFMWRFSFPSITPSSERLTDLFFISNYLQGVTLPPLDNWNPPHRFDYYYAFQHYGAALMGRVFNFGPGTSYNIAFGLLGALPLTLGVYIAGRVIALVPGGDLKRNSLIVLFIATIAFGGTGLSPLLKLAFNGPDKSEYVKPGMNVGVKKQAIDRYRSAQANHSRDHIIGAVRFIGSDRDVSFASKSTNTTSLAPLLFPETSGGVKGKKMVLPAENLGYQYFLGDYHPTVGGFFLLMLALALIFSVVNFDKASPAISLRWQRLVQAGLTFTVPLMLITNTWTLPLLVILILGWMIFSWFAKYPIHWVWLLGGGVAGTFLIYPFLVDFLSGSLPTPVKFVQSYAHTPASRFLAMHWPILCLLAMGFWEGRTRRVAWYFSALWLFLLILSEVIYIDDPTGDHFARTNTVMKWWGWIHVGVFATLGALLLSSVTKWLRWVCVAVMISVSGAAGYDLFTYYAYSGKYYAGQLHGHGWYTNNATNRQMFEYLEDAPQGVVLESILDNAYSNTSLYGIFNGKPVLLGWPSHLRTWHGDVPRVWIMKEEIDKFYKGELPSPLAWLRGNQVRYIVFGPKDNDKLFEAIHEKIKGEFAWYEFEHSRRRHTGIWVRVD